MVDDGDDEDGERKSDDRWRLRGGVRDVIGFSPKGWAVALRVIRYKTAELLIPLHQSTIILATLVDNCGVSSNFVGSWWLLSMR